MALSETKIAKAAEILMCLGQQTAKEVLAFLPEEAARAILPLMMQPKPLSSEARGALLSELRQRYARSAALPEPALPGGQPAPLELDAKTPPRQRSTIPFESIRDVDAVRLLEILLNEPPSIISLVLYYLPREKSAQIISGLTEEVRFTVILRLANLQAPTPQMLSRLEQMILQSLSDDGDVMESTERDLGKLAGARTLVEILGRTNPGIERGIYEFLQEKEPALAEEIRKQMFVFEDIIYLDSKTLQLVLREVTAQELALALKGVSPELRDLIYTNVSDNFRKAIAEEVELLGPVRISAVEEAQQSLAAAVRRMVEEGTITIRRNEETEMLI